jgi:hypothetical protein
MIAVRADVPLQVDDSGVPGGLEAFQVVLAKSLEEASTSSPEFSIARIVMTGDIEPLAAGQLASVIETIAPQLRGKIQGVDNPSFITAMGAACLAYRWHRAEPYKICQYPVSIG